MRLGRSGPSESRLRRSSLACRSSGVADRAGGAEVVVAVVVAVTDVVDLSRPADAAVVADPAAIPVALEDPSTDARPAGRERRSPAALAHPWIQGSSSGAVCARQLVSLAL